MSQNQEIIEAKLCAYIDDELDAAGRAELEKHLAANPQHQRLIEELRRTSALIHNLPHESAPPELAEAFNAHLERSVLLENVSDDVAAADLKAPRWPQLVAMAAITLLTIGLGIVVYFALPGTGVRPQFVQSSQRPAAPAATGMDDNQSSDGKLRDVNKSSNPPPQGPAPAKDEKAPLAFGSPAPGAAAGAVSNGTTASSADHLITPAAATQPAEGSITAASGSNPSSPVVLVMHADDPAEARRSLVLYLVQQDIAWEPSERTGITETLGRRDAAEMQKAIGGLAFARRKALSDQPATSQPASDAITDAAKATPTTGPSASTGNVSGELAANRLSLGALAATRPAPEAMKELKRAGDETAPASPVAATSKPEFAVSCKMTVEQANALRASLAQPGTFIDPLPGDFGSKTSPDTTAKQAATTQPANAPDFSLAGASPAIPPTTSPVAAAAPAPAAELDRSTNSLSVATQPAVAPGDASVSTSAGQPAGSPEPLLDMVIVVRPTEHSSTEPAVIAAPQSPTTAPVIPATQP